MRIKAISSAPELLALASGIVCEGAFRCIFCGAPAGDRYELPSSFTTRDTLRCPGSQYACRGCLLALEEVGTATYHDGVKYEWTKSYRRMCSHVITRDRVVMATKAHVPYLRSVCLEPPEPPFAISLAVSGQKHVLYRGAVCYSRESVCVTLEGERISYRPCDLLARLELCGRLVAATGKPALAESPGPSFWFRVCERYACGESLCSEWEQVRGEPLSQLASFLVPKKEDCDGEYPSDRHPGIPEARGGTDRPEPQAHRSGGIRKHQGRGQATLFDAV